MDELDKAYETVEMLIALDLPISKDQLENIERLEKENGRDQREDLKSYFYEKCFTNYTKRIMNIRQAKIRGEVIVAKPVLLLAIIDGINANMFKDNEFHMTEWLQSRYLMLMQHYKRSSQFDKPTDISNPFWHLQSDGFWHLKYWEEPQDGATPSKRWLKEKVSYAYFDDDLWMLLQNKVWRQKLRNYIVENKLTDESWLGKIATESFVTGSDPDVTGKPMDLKHFDIDDLKTLRPDLFKAVEQEVILGKMKLTKDDILTMIEPLSRSIKEFLKPYLTKLSAMTYNDIVDMENDIVDEVAEQLLNEFEEIEEIVRKRTNNYNKEAIFAKEPTSDYVVEKEKRHYHRRLSWDSALEVTKETSKQDFSTVKKEALVGDAIQYDGKRCKVIGKKTSANSMRLIIQYDDGTMDNVPNDWNRYCMMNNGKNGDYDPCSEAIRKFDITNKRKKKATVGDWVMRTSDNQIGKVVEIKKLGSGIEKLILELEDGSQSGVFNSTNLYWVLLLNT